MLTLSDVVSAASLKAVTEGLRSADGIIEAAADNLGTAARWGGPAVTTEALATAAVDLGFITAGEAAAQRGSGPSAFAADAASGAADGSSTFERTASGWTIAGPAKKAMPPSSTMRTGPVGPWCTEYLAPGWSHASSKVVNLDGVHSLMAACSSRVDEDLIPSSSRICRRG
jgi:hypothetical protein